MADDERAANTAVLLLEIKVNMLVDRVRELERRDDIRREKQEIQLWSGIKLLVGAIVALGGLLWAFRQTIIGGQPPPGN